MKKLMEWLLVIVVLSMCGGCMPASQQEVQSLTNMVNEIVPAVRQALSTESEDTKKKVDDVLVKVDEVNKAVATAEDPVDAVEKGWGATKDWNPYYGWGALGIALIKMLRDDKKKKGLEKGINRILGEAEPEQAKAMYDKMKRYQK